MALHLTFDWCACAPPVTAWPHVTHNKEKRGTHSAGNNQTVFSVKLKCLESQLFYDWTNRIDFARVLAFSTGENDGMCFHASTLRG